MTIRILTRSDVLAIPADDLPLLVLSDNLGLFGWRIRAHTGGSYSHSMWMHRPGRVVSQNGRLTDRPVTDYLTPTHRLKLWTSSRWTIDGREAARRLIDGDLRGDHRYDWVGIVGQWLGWTGLQLPGRWYCSEHAARILSVLDARYTEQHPSPAGLDAWCKSTAGYQVYGVYDPGLA